MIIFTRLSSFLPSRFFTCACWGEPGNKAKYDNKFWSVCRRPSLSQHVTELAQRVDFSEVVESRDGEPAVKKATQKWPWEQAHSKLK